ncbi:hypothetical protein P691DRAFT_799779 [Macrolepiota fuliginosa MF-IS2]|uniref:Uncharacterized protein n=1 Tax=Macrolepiota fuliginosa MF-IS2 TaxID=1400762 RepID=A0A9P5WZ75_9AGAR|nr:hypothetical protein P691DRAFT_799779 [Macrolepiota fuliginosa MF-IS2]
MTSRVSGLAYQIHDSIALQECFKQLIDKNPEYISQKCFLSCCILTWWNSDFAALKDHLEFKKEIQIMTGASTQKLGQYKLTNDQWELVENLIFDAPTKLFSQALVPLIAGVVPLLFELKLSLEALHDDEENKLSPVMHIAAQAAILMIDKYTLFNEECEIYYIAIDWKIEWFKILGFSSPQIQKIKEMVIRE